MPYIPLEWKDGPQGGTPISAANLNRMEQGIKDAHDDLDAATSAADADTLVRRDGNGRFQAADPSAAQDVATKGWVEATKPQIEVLTGTINNEGTIPLPSGYTQEQCKWMAAFAGGKNENNEDIARSINWSTSSRNVTSTASASEVVTISYIIIGVK